MKKSAVLFSLAAVFFAVCPGQGIAGENGPVYTSRKPPVVKESAPPSPPRNYPVKDCDVEVKQKTEEQTARYGGKPGEESLKFFRKECEDEVTQYNKMNDDNAVFYKKQMADYDASQGHEGERVEGYRKLFFAEEKAAKKVADEILATPGVSFRKDDIADIRMLKDNAHLMKGKTFITEARLIKRVSETTALFETAGYTTVQVKDIPVTQMISGSEYIVLVGAITGNETYHDKTINKPFDLPTIAWKAGPPCRVSLPDGLESHSAQCLPMAVIRKELGLSQ
ncbi:MAG: hypothetical protein M3O22_02890 [Pseudomonadota bacterium]|nr:hypothetical protein [Pseudomonadota bacterium]